MHSCRLCHRQFAALHAYFEHYRYHGSVVAGALCTSQSCSSTFRKYSTLSSHLKRTHGYVATAAEPLVLTCPFPACLKQVDTQTKLIGHLIEHLKLGSGPLPCPFPGCVSKIGTPQSLRTHVSRSHRPNRDTLEFHREQSAPSEPEACEEAGGDCVGLAEDEIHGAESEDDQLSERELLKQNFALFLLKLESEFHIPSKTVLYIQNEMCNIHCLSQEHILTELAKVLPKDTMDVVQSGFISDELNSLTSNDFRSTYLRHRYFRTQFKYVKPIEMSLGINRENSLSIFHYIPVKDSLDQLISNAPMHFSVHADQGCYTDFTACDSFNESVHDTIQVILYQDAFELVNPLGSAKGKFKLVGVYMTLGNLAHHCRARTESMQLVLLCREKDMKEFGQKAVFQPLIDDLRGLERVGLEFDGKSYKVKLCFIAGDNLGSHAVGGFVENFSSFTYFCRFCRISRAEFTSNPDAVAEKRTAQSYDACIAYLEQNPHEHERHGVTGKSPFNDLENFHVCNSGLPPCIGHDIFEGIVRYDLALFIKHFVKKQKWFTYEYLNNRIATFKYNAHDIKNKPAKVSAKGDKIAGHAIQNWTFLKLLPLYVASKLADTSDPVWQLTLELMELVDLVMAPKVTHAQVSYLRILSASYLQHRKSLFPSVPLRPKHHYITHYSDLIQEFGPLCHVWTLRFESKHCYFKKCIRSMGNFKNVTKSLSERHQLFQSMLSTKAFFPTDVEIVHMKDHEQASQMLRLQEFFLNNNAFVGNVSCCSRVMIKGTSYTLDDYILISGTRFDVVFGVILGILADSADKLTFLVQHVSAAFLPSLFVYHLGTQGDEVVTLVPEQLLHPVPYKPYLIGDNFVIRLDFGFPVFS